MHGLGYYCTNCGTWCHPDEICTVDENRGECFGFPAKERICFCPFCGSDDLLEKYFD